MIDRRVLRDIDWVLIGVVLLIAAIGMAAIYSSSRHLPGNYPLRQLAWIAVSLFALFLLISVDYQTLMTYSPYLYLALVLIMAGMLAIATLVAGTKSWIRIGFFQVQPSELMKLVLVLFLAHLFSEYKKDHLSSSLGWISVGLVALPSALVILQPDLGTAMTYLPILLGAFLLAGLRKKMVVILLISAMALGLAGWNFALKDYQKRRLMTLIEPSSDPRGAGYQILQSKIAIGSGGVTGKGFLKGSQSQLRFLPARHTDFIFSVIGEEFGFLGVLAVILLYFFLVSRMFLAVGKARDRAGVYIVFMSASLITFQFLVNVLMIIGLFPVTGVPLPLLSYGGSSLLSNFLACGLVLNVKMRRFVNV